MHAFFTHRVAVPGEKQLACIAWLPHRDTLACGTSSGRIRIVGFGSIGSHADNYYIDEHSDEISCFAVNPGRMLSADSKGRVVDWALLEDRWVNRSAFNRNSTSVVSMVFSPDASMVCLVYEDGGVMLTKADMSRLWFRDYRKRWSKAAWSGNSKFIALAQSGEESEVTIIDSDGGFVSKLSLSQISTGGGLLVCLAWSRRSLGHLAVLFNTGRGQLMKSHLDESPSYIDCNCPISHAEWNSTGTLLAIASAASVFLFSPTGEHVRTVPTLTPKSGSIGALSWNPDDSGLVVSVNSELLFMSIRMIRPKCSSSSSVAISGTKSISLIRSDSSVVELKMPNVIDLQCGFRDGCFGTLVSAGFESCIVQIFDEAAQLLTRRRFSVPAIRPHCFGVNGEIAVIAGKEEVFVWNWISDTEWTITTSQREEDGAGSSVGDVDCIVAVALSETTLAIARESGVIHMYARNRDMCPVYTESVSSGVYPEQILFNNVTSMLAIVDIGKRLFLLDLTKGDVIDTGKKDCVDIVWSSDSSDLLACVVKHKLYVLRVNGRTEEPLDIGDRVVVGFHRLDLVIAYPEGKGWRVEKVPSKSLRDCRDFVVGLTPGELGGGERLVDMLEYVRRNRHVRLWFLLAESAVLHGHLEIATKAFAECGSFAAQGARLVRRMYDFTDPDRAHAEGLLWFGRLAECESYLAKKGRMDIWSEICFLCGDYENAIKADPASTLVNANMLGHFHFNKGEYELAMKCFLQSPNRDSRTNSRLLNCLISNSDYLGIVELSRTDGVNRETLQRIGRLLDISGLVDEAVEVYARAGLVEEAINACVEYGRIDLLVSSKENVKNHKSLIAALPSVAPKDMLEMYERGLVTEGLEAVLERNVDSENIYSRKIVSLLIATETTDSAVRAPAHDTAEECWLIERWYYYMHRGQYVQALSVVWRITRDNRPLHVLQFQDAWKQVALSALLAREEHACSKALAVLETDEAVCTEERGKLSKLAFRIFRKGEIAWKNDHATCWACGESVKVYATECGGCDTKFECDMVTGLPVIYRPTHNLPHCTQCGRLSLMPDTCALCHIRTN